MGIEPQRRHHPFDQAMGIKDQLALLRKTETNATNYRLSASGFIAEVDRMQLHVREFLSAPAAVAPLE